MSNTYNFTIPQFKPYFAPDISRLLYEGIGNLPQDYYQGQQNAQQLAMQRMFPNGLTPYLNPDGSLKPGAYSDIANKAAQIGGLPTVMPMLNNLLKMDLSRGNDAALQGADRLVNPGAGGGYQGGYQQPGYAPPQTAGPQSNTLPGRTPGPQSAAPTAQPREPSGEMDNLAGLGTEMYGSGRDASRAIGQVAREMRVRPSDTLSPDQISEARDLLGLPRIAALVPASARARADTDPASGPQPTFGQSEDVANVPRSTSATERGVNGTPGPAPDVASPGAVRPAGIPQRTVATQPIAPPGVTPQGRVLITPQGAPLPAAQPAPQVAQAASQAPLQNPPGYDQARINALENGAQLLYRRAALIEGAPGSTQDEKNNASILRARADKYLEERKQLIESLLQRTQPTGTQKEALTPGSPEAIARLEGGKKQATDQAEQEVKDAASINALGMRARMDLPHLEHASNIIDQPGYYSGPFQNVVERFKQGQWLLGGDRTALTPTEMARKEFANAELFAIRELGNSGLGRILQREVESVQKTIMGLHMSPESDRELVEIAVRTRRLMTAAQKILSDNDGKADQRFRDKLMDYYDKHPLISPAEMEDQRLIAPPRIRAGNADEYQRLQINPGDPVRMWSEKNKQWQIRNAPQPSQ